MDLSKLGSNEKLGFYGAVLVIIGAIVSATQFGGAGAGGWLDLILAIAMIAIVFLPQWSPQTELPGSKGSLMLVVGGIAAIGSLLSLLGILAVMGSLFGALYGGLWVIGYLVVIVGGLLMGWAGWQQFQAEGGKFQIGTTSGGGGTPPAGPPAGPPPSA